MQALIDTNAEYLAESALEQIPENLGQLSFVALEFPAAECDLLASLKAQRSVPQHYWRSRDGLREYAGIGAAISLHTQRNTRQECEAALREVLHEHPHGHKLTAFVASSFDESANFGDAEHSDDTLWNAFPSFQAIVPEVCIERNDQDYRVVICLAVTAKDSQAKLAQRACRTLEKTLLRIAQKSGKQEAERDSLLHEVEQTAETIQSLPTKAAWETRCQQVLQVIESGELEKLVLARTISLELSGEPHPIDLAYSLQTHLGTGYTFVSVPRKGTAFVCQTPESLFYLDGMSVTSDALGGSALEVLDTQEQASEKLQREHGYVVSDLKDKMRSLSSGAVESCATEVVSLPYISHLRTRVSATLDKSVDALQILSTLHPTPAVGVYPSEKGVARIKEIEGTSRGWYSGPVGVVRQDSSEFAVALRGVLLNGAVATLYGGAGIVAGSEPYAEWEEIEGKLAPILSVFNAV